MKKLVESMIKPILEANPKITKIVGIYGGRFQPFGPHHYKTYKWLAKQVDVAYITTSNIKSLPRHPMNFKEKVRHMSLMGVPKNKISMEKSPFVAKNLEKKFNSETTAFVYVFGAKDAGRLSGGKYFQNYKKNKGNLKGYKEHGYYLTAPHVSISVGGREVSGTAMRELLGSPKVDDKKRTKLFKQMFGYFNQGVFNMLTNKFKKLFEGGIGGFSGTVTAAPASKGSGSTTSNVSVPGAIKLKKKKKKKKKDNEDYDYDDFAPGSKFNKKTKQKLLRDISFKNALKRLKIPLNLLKPTSKQKLINYIATNPQVVSQLLRLATESKDTKLSSLEMKQVILLAKAMKEVPGSKNQKKIKKQINVIRKKLGQKPIKEEVKLPIKIGDTVKMGKFKNKKVVIKTLDWNEKGDLLINGRPALKFRVTKSEEIDEFLIHNDISKLIKEISASSGKGMVDDGPSALMGGMKGYSTRNQKWAEKLGYEIVNYILDVEITSIPPNKDEFDSREAVSYLPAGIGTGKTPNNPENLTGARGYNKWLKNMRKIAQEVGFKLMKYQKQKEEEKQQKKSVAKDSRETLKQQKKDETEKVKSMGESFSKNWWKENLLLEGGAYGHMAHPFDDKNLTFGDLKKIITLGLGGQLNREDNVTEKLDGQNIMISWKDGQLIAARNKGHIKNGGKNALTTKGVAAKFKGRGDIRNAFVYAMRDLEKAIASLSEAQRNKIFDNGHNFMNLEVMWPKSANVIDYDKAELIFHGALKYDKSANVKGEVKGSGRILAGMIEQRNKNIQKYYSIGKPVFLTVPKHQDFGKMKGTFLSKVQKLQNQYALKDSDTLALYHQSYWQEYIYNAAQQFDYKISNKVLKNLTKRWAFFDKKYSIANIKSDLKKHPKFLEWVLSTDKNNHKAMVKKNMKPFEILFFQVGAEIMKNMDGFMAANPDKTIQGIRKRLRASISSVRKGGDLKKLNTLKAQLEKFQKIGGDKAIVPSEGIVFKYKGNTYKFTGAFAPINQITGLMSF